LIDISTSEELFHKPIRNVGSTIEAFLAMTDAIEHRTIKGVHGVLIEIECAAWVHDPVIDAVTDQERTLDLIRSADERKLLYLFSRLF
jgi:hypothetical protein